MVTSAHSNDAYELDLARVLRLIRSNWLLILLITILIVFLFGTVLVLFGSGQDAYSETIQYYSESLLNSVDIELLPKLITSERVLYQVYESDQNPEKGGFDDYAGQFSASVVHQDAISLKVTGTDLTDTRRVVDIWQEIIDQDVIHGLRSSRIEHLGIMIQDKLQDYLAANQAFQSYYEEAEIEEKSLLVNQYQALISQYNRIKNDQELLKISIQNLYSDLDSLNGNIQLTPSDLFLLERILAMCSSDTLVIGSGERLYSELLLPTSPSRDDILSLLEGIEENVDADLAYQVAEILNASAKISVLRQEIEQDPRLIELEELANYQKRQYLNAIDELDDLSEEGYSVSYSWMEPKFSVWERISIIHVAVIAVAAIFAAVFFLIIREWWKSNIVDNQQIFEDSD